VKHGIQIKFVAASETSRRSFKFLLKQPVAMALINGDSETLQASVMVPGPTGC